MRKSFFAKAFLALFALTSVATAQSIHTGGTAGAYFNNFGPAVQAGRYPKIGTPFLKSFDNTRVSA